MLSRNEAIVALTISIFAFGAMTKAMVVFKKESEYWQERYAMPVHDYEAKIAIQMCDKHEGLDTIVRKPQEKFFDIRCKDTAVYQNVEINFAKKKEDKQT